MLYEVQPCGREELVAGGPTCVADRIPLLMSAQRQDTAAVRMAAAVLPACHCRLGTQMSFTMVSR